MEINDTITPIIDLAAANADVRYVEDTPFVVVPDTYRVEDLEKFLPAPTRHRGISHLRDVPSFIRMVNEEKIGGTRIYGTNLQDQLPTFVAVFNDGADGTPGWQDHQAKLVCDTSREWKLWIGANGKKMNQVDFAQFIEDNLPDVFSPPAAEMLEISRTLEAKKKVNFSSGIRLSNGENELTFEEAVSGTAGKGKLTVPEQFTIAIPVLENGQAWQVEARLRYRIGDGGALSMWYDLIRPAKVLEAVFKEAWAEIENETFLKIFNGVA